MGNWDAKLLERVFPHFAKILWMGKMFAKLLEMLTGNIGNIRPNST
jgi:hypothetical protein